jgi:uncharacterized protein (UPF0218 family)
LKTYRLTDELRARLKHPIGTLIVGSSEETVSRLSVLMKTEKPARIIAVGDFLSSEMARHGIQADVYILDNKIMRKPIKPIDIKTEEVLHVGNPASTITHRAWETVCIAVKSTSIIKIIVDGEEDLLALPAIICAPATSFVIYGQPHKGIVLVRVSENKRREIKTLLEGMTLE